MEPVDFEYFVGLLQDVSMNAHEDNYRFILSVFKFWNDRGFVSHKQYSALESMRSLSIYSDPYDDDIPF